MRGIRSTFEREGANRTYRLGESHQTQDQHLLCGQRKDIRITSRNANSSSALTQRQRRSLIACVIWGPRRLR